MKALFIRSATGRTRARSAAGRTRARSAAGRMGSQSGGFTLVELLVAMLLLAIAISMSFIVATNIDTITVGTLRQSHAAESAQNGMAEVSKYLAGAVSPEAAASAQDATVASDPSCWGLDSPAPSGGVSLNADGAASLALATAYDFDLVYCGYAPATAGHAGADATPSVYEITFEPGSCQGVSCTLAIYDCGSTYNPGTAALASSTYLDPSTCVSTHSPVWTVPRVWCDQSCQSGSAGSAPGDTPALFNYYAGPAGEYSATGATSVSLNSSGHPLGLASGDNALGLQLVQLVVLKATVLATSGSASDAGSAGAGTQVSEQVWLTNMLSGGYQPATTSSAALALGPSGMWPLDSATGGVVTDLSGNGDTGTVNGVVSVLPSASPPLLTPLSVPVMDFTGSGFISTATPVAAPGPEVFSISAWFMAPATLGGGGIAQFANSETGTPSNYDRQLYIGTDGKLVFGICDPSSPGCPYVISSPAPVNNGQWYFAVATLSSAGMSLYLDGELVAYSSAATEAQQFSQQGYWRIGELGNQGGWPDTPWANNTAASSAYPFVGDLADVAVYSKALSPSQIQGLFQATGNYSTCFGYAEAAEQPSSMWTLADPQAIDPALTPAVADVSPAPDGYQGSSPPSNPWAPDTGTIQGVVTEGSTPGAAPCDTGVPAMSFTGSGYVSTANQMVGPQTFSIVAWFETSSTNGGIAQFANSETGTPGNYDRHLYVNAHGNLVFGVCDPSDCPATISSPQSVTDGKWHLAVATLSSAGMALYLDGQLVAANTSVTAAQSFSGWWRIGELGNAGGWPRGNGNGTYSGGTVLPFNGDIADVAVFPTALAGTQVQALYEAGQPS